MVAPGLGHDVIAQLLPGVRLGAGDELADDAGVLDVRGDLPRELHPVDDAVEVGLPALGPVVEVAHPDVGDIPRIGRAQPHGPGAIPRPALEHEEAHPVVVGLRVIRVVRVVPVEVRGEGEDDDIGAVIGGGTRAGDEGRERPVRRIRPTAVVLPLLHEVVIGFARCGQVERRPVEDREVGVELVDDRDLVAVVEVLPHPRQVDDDGDAELPQLGGRTDPGEFEQLRGVERPAGDDHLAAGAHDAGRRRHLRGSARLRGRPVEPGTGQVLDPDGPGAVEDHPRGQRILDDRQLLRVSIPRGEQSLPGAVAVPTAGGHGHERHALVLRRGVGGVDVTRQGHLGGDVEPLPARRLGGVDDVEEPRFATGDRRIRPGRRQPSAVPVVRLLVALGLGVAGQGTGVDALPVLDALEDRPHVRTAPGLVPGQRRQGIPVPRLRSDVDEGADRGTAPERAAPRIEDPALLVDPLRIPRSAVGIVVVGDEEVPHHVDVLAGIGLHDGDVVVPAPVIAAGLEDDDAEPRRGEVRGERSAARPRPDDDEIGGCLRGCGVRHWR